MNVKVVNKYETLLNSLEIDIIKSVSGVFTPEELIMQFSNFFYNKMILDITAIANYQDISTIQELSVNMDMSKVVLLLDDSEVVNSPRYLSSLVSMGIYNFTRNIDAVSFLIDNPNTYKDVAHYHQLNNVEEPVKSSPKEEEKPSKKSFITVEDTKPAQVKSYSLDQRIIGVKNVTEHAGSTTLTYMLKRELEKSYRVIAAEVNTNNFIFLNDRSLRHTTTAELRSFINANANTEVILLDLNDGGNESLCTDVLYLIEPGLIKLNKLIRHDQAIFEKLKGKKVILNRSVLSSEDVSDFEHESRSKVYFNIPYLDDKLDNYAQLKSLLIKMGFDRLDRGNHSEKNGKLFSIFK